MEIGNVLIHELEMKGVFLVEIRSMAQIADERASSISQERGSGARAYEGFMKSQCRNLQVMKRSRGDLRIKKLKQRKVETESLNYIFPSSAE